MIMWTFYTRTYTHLSKRCWAASSATRLNRTKKIIKWNKTFFCSKLDLASNCICVLVLVLVCVCVYVLSSLLSKFIIFQDVCILFFCFTRVFPLPSISRCYFQIRFFVNAVCLFYHRRCRRCRCHFIFIHSLASRHHLISLHSILFSGFNVLGIRKSEFNEWWKKKKKKNSSAWQIYCQRYLPFKLHVCRCMCVCCVPCLNVNKIVCPWLKKES